MWFLPIGAMLENRYTVWGTRIWHNKTGDDAVDNHDCHHVDDENSDEDEHDVVVDVCDDEVDDGDDDDD